MVCRSSLNLSLSAGGESIITPDILLANPACDPADFYVEIFDNQGNTLGNKITCDQVGQTLDAGVFHQTNGISCWTEISVSDFFRPRLSCRDTIISCMADYSVAAIGSPVVTDNCGVASLTFTENFTTRDCFYTNSMGDTITAELNRIWTATDVNGNSSTCSQSIYLKRNTIAQVVFPANRDDIGLPALDCSQNPQNLALTGEPSIENHPLSSGGHCELIVSSNDQIIEFCGPGGYRILRNWRVVDYCTGNFREHIQIIKITDTTAPTINCIADIQEFTDTYSCNATITLPTVSTTDDCSAVAVTPSWEYGSGFGPYENIPVGNHEITYTATDDCGNASTCVVMLIVSDNIIPAMVCEGNTQVVLTNNGEAIISAENFDDGSYDNCQIARFEVSRDSGNYKSEVRFDCMDINTPVLVNLRAYDVHGNFNVCEISVVVVDGIKPIITCPPTVTITCKEDYENLDVTGLPTVSDACGVDTIYYSDQVNINNCNVGKVVRTWMAIDVNGNEQICQQQILIEDNTVFSVSFPANYQAFECGADLSPAIAGVPVLTNYNCKEVNIAFEDRVFSVSAPACQRILRDWTVINWCEYELNSGSTDGYYTYTQEIILSDNIAPELNCFADTTIGIYGENCHAGLVSLPIVTAEDCSDNISIENDSPYAFSTGADASGNYPVGVHQIIYTASDGCGNMTTKRVEVTVEDAQIPNVRCVGSITLSINNQGFVIVTPAMINLESTDNCTSPADLIYSVDRDTFTCADVGTQQMILSVTDENGNRAFCTTIVEIQNNVAACPVNTVTISGNITKENGSYVDGFWVYLTGDKIDSVRTDALGNYTFSEVPLGGDYIIKPNNNSKVTNGVNTLDLVFMMQHLLEIRTLSSPYRLLAADLNESKSISSLDIITMRRAILFVDTTFSRTQSWKFVDAGFDFLNVNNPIRANYQQAFEVIDLQEEIDAFDFIAVKMGDLNDNGSAQSLSTTGDTREEIPPVNLMVKDQILEAGTEVSIPVHASGWNSVLGLQFTATLSDAVTLLDINISEAGEALGWTADNFAVSPPTGNTVRGSWANNRVAEVSDSVPLFFIKLKINKSTTVRNVLKLNDEKLKTEAYSKNVNHEIKTVPLKLIVEATVVNEINPINDLLLYPNPAHDFVQLEFVLFVDSEINWEAYDATGQIMGQGSRYLNAGTVKMILPRNVLGNKGGLRYFKIKEIATNKIHRATAILVE